MMEKQLFVDVSITIPKNKISVILGAKWLWKIHSVKDLCFIAYKPEKGSILLDGKSISYNAVETDGTDAGLLPQSPIVPEGMKVTDLVAKRTIPIPKAAWWTSKRGFCSCRGGT